jgi:hypothetical protein
VCYFIEEAAEVVKHRHFETSDVHPVHELPGRWAYWVVLSATISPKTVELTAIDPAGSVAGSNT